MGKSNKKFWSLFFGCVLANSYVWLASFGVNAEVPSSFQGHTNFVLDYYSVLVTAILAALATLCLIMVMNKTVKLCVSDHILWLILPSISFIAFTLFTAQILLVQILSAAIPALVVLSGFYLIKQRDKLLPERLSVW